MPFIGGDYKNLGGDSGIYRYEIEYVEFHSMKYGTIRTYLGIYVYFKRGHWRQYLYDLNSLGKPSRLDAMIYYAEKGEGLNSYINHNVKYKYETRR